MKAYKLFDLSTNEFIISRDVTFHEDIFPCQKNPKENDDPFAQIVLPIPTRDILNGVILTIMMVIRKCQV